MKDSTSLAVFAGIVAVVLGLRLWITFLIGNAAMRRGWGRLPWIICGIIFGAVWIGMAFVVAAAIASFRVNSRVERLLKVARGGNSEAQFQLGLIYAHCPGVRRDYAKAYYWFDLALSGNFVDTNQRTDAESERNEVLQHLTTDDLQRIHDLSGRWLANN